MYCRSSRGIDLKEASVLKIMTRDRLPFQTEYIIWLLFFEYSYTTLTSYDPIEMYDKIFCCCSSMLDLFGSVVLSEATTLFQNVLPST